MSENQDFEFAGRKFKVGKIDAMKQFHIARRIGPILAELFPEMAKVAQLNEAKKLDKLTEDRKLELVGKFALPVMTGLSRLSDSDANHVLYGLLEAIEVKQEPLGNWAKVANGSLIMMQDLDLRMLVQLAGRAFMFNIAGFFAALPS